MDRELEEFWLQDGVNGVDYARKVAPKERKTVVRHPIRKIGD